MQKKLPIPLQRTCIAISMFSSYFVVIVKKSLVDK